MKLAFVFALLSTSLATPAPESSIMDGIHHAISNVEQVIDSYTNQIKNNPSHLVSQSAADAITALDSQIDNVVNTVAQFLGPWTGGISQAIGGILLGPFFQSVTNGAEVLIGNIVGMPFDFLDTAVVDTLIGNYTSLIKMAKGYSINTSRLTHLTSRLDAWAHPDHA